MAENTVTLDGDNKEGIRYVFGDQEFILGEDESTSGAESVKLEDIICSDGSRAILVDGQYFVTDNNQAVLLQEGQGDLTQFYIDNSDSILVDPDDLSNANLFEGTEVVQLIEDSSNSDQQIIYYTSEDVLHREIYSAAAETSAADSENDSQSEHLNINSVQDEDGNVYPFKRIKLENSLLSFNAVEQDGDGNGLSEQTDGDDKSVQYAVIENNGNYHQVAYRSLENDDSQTISAGNLNVAEDDTQADQDSTDGDFLDLSRITGRNLITGQTVTLHSYMEKLKKKFNTDSISSLCSKGGGKFYTGDLKKPDLSDLLDKKISIGRTKSGKKVVGKIINIKKKALTTAEENDAVQSEDREEDDLVINDSLSEHSENAPSQIKNPASPVNLDSSEECVITSSPAKNAPSPALSKVHSITKENVEEISKTLGGVMEMESVRKKLENKNIVVKLVEKWYLKENNGVKKSTAYSYGYMERETSEGEGEEEVSEKWKFVPDQENLEHEIGEGERELNGEECPPRSTKFSITTSLTIVISHTKRGARTIRVNLNPAPGNLCTICAQYLPTSTQLRLHMSSAHGRSHSPASTTVTFCELCKTSFENPEDYQRHLDRHVQDGELFPCSGCSKCFSSQSRLQKHLPVHDVHLRPLECSVCEVRCSSQWGLKKHLLTHTGIKPFSCDHCQKQFLSQYDLNYHRKMHFPEKNFACEVCMRLFSRHSNLMRHMEIHKGNGALYKCSICYCSYNFISSLTRHMVQNHIDAKSLKPEN